MQSIPEPTEDEKLVARTAFQFFKESTDPEAAFVSVYAQQMAEIRWLRSLLHSAGRDSG